MNIRGFFDLGTLSAITGAVSGLGGLFGGGPSPAEIQAAENKKNRAFQAAENSQDRTIRTQESEAQQRQSAVAQRAQALDRIIQTFNQNLR